MNDTDLEKELYLLDRESSSSSPKSRRREEKSIGSGSCGNRLSLKETNQKSEKSLTQSSSPRPKRRSGESSKELKHQARLVREQRKAEEVKLKRLQEESKLLEEKRRAEEVRLKALQEEAKLFEAKRQEEQARRNAEAMRVQEHRKMEETQREKELELIREQRKEEEARIARLREENRTAIEKSNQHEEEGAIHHETLDQSNDIPSLTGTSAESVDSELPSPRREGDEVRNYLRKAQIERASKFRKQQPEEIQLPPAFQLIHEQTKRIKKLS
jgi:hypothetical protein